MDPDGCTACSSRLTALEAPHPTHISILSLAGRLARCSVLGGFGGPCRSLIVMALLQAGVWVWVWVGPLCQATSMLGVWPRATAHAWRILVASSGP